MGLRQSKVVRLVKLVIMTSICSLFLSSIPGNTNNGAAHNMIEQHLDVKDDYVESSRHLIKTLLEADDFYSSDEIEVTEKDKLTAFGNITVDISHNFSFKLTPRELPKCPQTVILDQDRKILDTLRQCGSKAMMSFAPELEVWRYTEDTLCDGVVRVFDKEVVHLRNVVVDKRWCSGRACGRDVNTLKKLKSENKELDLRTGFFRIPCDPEQDLKIYLRGADDNHLNKWADIIEKIGTNKTKVDLDITAFYIAVKRYEYDDIYRSIIDVYNAFLTAIYFSINPRDCGILLIDGCPSSDATGIWSTLFGSVTRIHELPTISVFRQMAWNKLGYNSDLLDFHSSSLAYSEEFRDFILDGYELSTERDAICSSLRVVFVYQTSNQLGDLQRVLNMLNNIRLNNTKISITSFSVEDMSLQTQVRCMESADILVVTRNNQAGLLGALLLPKHAGIIEVYLDPTDRVRRQLETMARWRRLQYAQWKANQTDLSFQSLVKSMCDQMCSV